MSENAKSPESVSSDVAGVAPRPSVLNSYTKEGQPFLGHFTLGPIPWQDCSASKLGYFLGGNKPRTACREQSICANCDRSDLGELDPAGIVRAWKAFTLSKLVMRYLIVYITCSINNLKILRVRRPQRP